ncbi:hypothetical protein QBZ16_003996 [Prototheca wickerhamii]|uniref:SAP domain-containing protein n=1 Tax=Prototheca wickerhamii TaxID=3111 RepID=A0AAD9IH11_PROWI|nr:hypothetical protein QBZ16_003996 [Prototheca wickerhamii]
MEEALSSYQRLVGLLRVPDLQLLTDSMGLSKKGRKADLQMRLLGHFGLAPGAPAGVPQALAPDYLSGVARLLEAQPPLGSASARMALKDLAAALPGGAPGGERPGTAARAPIPAPLPFPADLQAKPPASQQAPASPRVIRCICGSNYEHGPLRARLRDLAARGVHGRGAGARGYRCERCRAALADPFWTLAEADLVPPALLRPLPGRPPVVTTQGIQSVQGVERVFYVTSTLAELVARQRDRHRLVLACIQLSDEVPCRVHWPRNMDLRCNGVSYRPTGRANNAKMGINARDEAADLGALCSRGRNALSLAAAEGGAWAVLLQHVRRNSREDVKSLMRAPEGAAEAAARVARLVAGDDDDLLVESQAVSLRDPMSGARMACPARFVDASGLQAFDLDAFLSLAERNRKWQDPVTLKNSTVRQLQVDAYMQVVLECVAGVEDVDEVELDAQGRWRPILLDARGDPRRDAPELGPFSVVDDPTERVREAIRAAAGAKRVKQEPAGTAPTSSESEDAEEAELRAAAAAVRGLAGGSRQTASALEPEVIDLLDDSSEDEATHTHTQPREPAPAPSPARPSIANAVRAASSGRPPVAAGSAANHLSQPPRCPAGPTPPNAAPPRAAQTTSAASSSALQAAPVNTHPSTSATSPAYLQGPAPAAATTASSSSRAPVHPTNPPLFPPPAQQATSSTTTSRLQLPRPPVPADRGQEAIARVQSMLDAAAARQGLAQPGGGLPGPTSSIGGQPQSGHLPALSNGGSMPPTPQSTGARPVLSHGAFGPVSTGGAHPAASSARTESNGALPALSGGVLSPPSSAFSPRVVMGAVASPTASGAAPMSPLQFVPGPTPPQAAAASPLAHPPPGLAWNPVFLQFINMMQGTGALPPPQFAPGRYPCSARPPLAPGLQASPFGAGQQASAVPPPLPAASHSASDVNAPEASVREPARPATSVTSSVPVPLPGAMMEPRGSGSAFPGA